MFVETATKLTFISQKVKEGTEQKMGQSERNLHSTNRGVGKNQNDTYVL